MPTSPNTDNYTLGKGIVYFNQKNLSTGLYGGERDLGNAPSFSFNIALEKLEHFSSRGGLKAKDKEIISKITPSVSFTLDEVNVENLALLTLADSETVTQTAGAVEDEIVVANLDKRVALAHRNLTYWLLPYDDVAANNVLFVAGETVTGAGGASGIVLAVTGTATSGTLTIARTNSTAFVDNEALTGDIAGQAEVNSLTGGTLGTGTPVVHVTNSAGTVTYTAGVHYTIDTSLKDDVIGRIKFLSAGGTVVEGSSVKVTYGYAATTYTKIKAFNNTQTEGFLRFVSDNPAGNQQELQIWRVSLTPNGDTALIGDDWSTLSFVGEILKDETSHPDSPYMNILM